MRIHPLMRVATVLLSGLAGGCAESPFPLAPVSGRVTLDGKPVADARVVFWPRASVGEVEAGPNSMGETDADGRYSLQTVTQPADRGAVVASHRVIVSTRRSRLDPENPEREIVEAEERIPLRYVNHRNTPLRFDVPATGSEAADFELTSQ